MTNDDQQKKSALQFRFAGWKHSTSVRYVLFALLVVMFYVSLAPKLLPETYDIAVGLPSEKEILAPMDIPDTKATLKAQEEAAEKVGQVYTILPLRNETLVAQMLDRIFRLNQDDQVSEEDKIKIYREELPQRVKDYVQNFIMNNRNSSVYSATLFEEVTQRIDEQQYHISEETFIKIPRLTAEDINAMKPVAADIVARLTADPIVEAQTARAKVAEMVSTSSLSKRTAREVVQELARLSITANKFYDEEATKAAKVEARENTPTVYIKQGDVLVHKGERITQEMYTLLEKNGLLKDEVDYSPQLGLVLLSLLMATGLIMFIRQSEGASRFKYNNAQFVMLLLIIFITIASMHVINILQSEQQAFIGYLAPIATGAMLITLLLDLPLAYLCSFLFSVLASIILNQRQSEMFDFQFGFFALVTSFAAIFAIHRASQRSTLLKAGIMICLFGALSIFALQLIDNQDWTQTSTLYALGFSVAGGLLTTILVIGLMPFFEVTFGILSALKLVELSNPNHPLLRKLLTETPGTYHHSVMVGNLSEAAAEAIGANGLLCRVGSYYHDIGKTKRPSYFIENQNNMENPHDFIDPKLSKSIIIAHARDGVEMQKEYKLPKPIRDIAEQHHGTTFLHYFYHKALRLAEEQGVEPDFTEDDFRYPGPKAQSKEAAVVGIADSVEAAVRSLRKPTVEQVESMIEKIIKSRLDDHQFNECDLTMRELDIIAQTLKETVMGIFHSRIEYPEEVKKSKENEEKDRGQNVNGPTAGLEQ
ncbi:HDIG domain-containing protein [Paenibacillus phoenicis]|uniref:HDIG domain-containing protein n=1 Tax=Paenibacillus phoenicis TaxID=554117 RepID=A0ABU5PK11_9BACL|nr:MULTISPECIES: HDIG domain-containing metalloprotein [Paenibacillus]EES72437.1 7TM receptor with intracellular HD hydrolase [Paenibacillus sp. oral taxon 786 str. D14]MCT2194855.1 HDIG domain-containing protein [Paenibacillus sp. p3-SID1389]MEA3570296.1 HDIG domain-containing protein [Paenibacillus phoenicis]